MLLNSYATQLFEKSLCVIYRNSIVILINEDIYDLNECLDRLKKSYLYINKETLLGVSLNFCGVKRLYEFYDQCVYAIKKGMEQNCEQRLYMFYFYGADGKEIEMPGIKSVDVHYDTNSYTAKYVSNSKNADLPERLKSEALKNTLKELGCVKNEVKLEYEKAVKIKLR